MKKIIVSLLLLLPLGLVAQEMKVAYVNTDEVFNLMPEVSAAESALEAMANQYRTMLESVQKDLEEKYQAFIAQQDSLTENIKAIRAQELESIQARGETIQQSFAQERQKKQEELMAPIYEKIEKAITQVGEEEGYLMILNPQAFLYKSKSLIDATAKVKAKMGLR